MINKYSTLVVLLILVNALTYQQWILINKIKHKL